MSFIHRFFWFPLKSRLADLSAVLFGENSSVTDGLAMIANGIETIINPDSRYGKNSGINQVKIDPKSSYGLNVAGFIRGEFGLGASSRSFISALDKAVIPYAINNVELDVSRFNDNSVEYFALNNPYSVNVIHVNMDHTHWFHIRKSPSYFKQKYNIGYWMWELDSLPEEWLDSFNYYDEIWVPSNFVLDVISKVSHLPVMKVPISMDIDQNRIEADRSLFGLEDDEYIFLFNFDFNSYIARKNTLNLVNAFKKAFGSDDSVRLVLKYINKDQHRKDYDMFVENIKNVPNITTIEGYFTREELYSLVAACDCYVSLHRSEGFGLTIAEAMYLGKPVIATGYSGNMDFMTVNNSFPVKYEMIEVGVDEYPPFKKGFYWAEPDIDHAAGLMRYVYENPGEAGEIGRRASEDIKKYFSPAAVGDIIKKRLDMIYASGLNEEE